MSVEAVTPQTERLDVGDTWDFRVSVHPRVTPVARVIKPAIGDAEPEEVTVAVTGDDDTGIYTGLYVLEAPGRYLATMSVEGIGGGSESFTVDADPPEAARPNRNAIKTYLGQTGLSYDDDQIDSALTAELAAQDAVCRIRDYTADLAEALKRRVARNLAMHNVPLGIQADETGGTRVGSIDPEIRRLEAPYKKRVVG
jgi:hypothetical protein